MHYDSTHQVEPSEQFRRYTQGVETAPHMLGASEAMLARKSFLTLNRYLRVQDRLLRA